MKKFVERAMDKVSRMNAESIRGILRLLVDENERYEAILDSMYDGIIVCGPEHVPIIINKASERLISMKQSELLSVPLWESIKDPELSKFTEKYLAGEESVTGREFYIEYGGKSKILSFDITPLVKNGKIQGTLFHIVDVTEKRRNEAKLHQAESLASLTTVAAGVAHEIKNPLGSMSIHVQLMKKALGENITPSVSRYVNVVSEEIERLNNIVVEFLFAVRPVEIIPINDDINQLIRELVDFMEVEITNANISIVQKLDDNIPLIPFDKKYIKQALLNLVKNAVSAMPEGGTLSFSTKEENNSVVIKISDTGLGIPSEALGKIFEPYYTTKRDGTGLGLTLTYKIVKEHGGEISVKSKQNVGTDFSISLPIPQKDYCMLDSSSELKKNGDNIK